MALQDTSGLGEPLRGTPGPTFLVVGAASRDVTDADSRGWRLGGAACYGALALARLGLRVRALVGVDGLASGAPELALLRAAGVELELVRLRRGPVFINDERPSGRAQRCLEVSDPIPPDALPHGWLQADAVFLGPVAAELPEPWAAVPPPAATVALGWQGLLRRLVAGATVERVPPTPNPFLDRADLVAVSVDDVGSERRLSSLVDLIRPGATLVVTRGARGGTALTSHRPARSSLHAYPAIPSDRVVDATGAGDVFLATLLAALVAPEAMSSSTAGPSMTLGSALRFAAAAASLAVEGLGLEGVPTLGAVRRRVGDVA